MFQPNTVHLGERVVAAALAIFGIVCRAQGLCAAKFLGINLARAEGFRSN